MTTLILTLLLTACAVPKVLLEGRAHHSKDSCLLHLAQVESVLSRPDQLPHAMSVTMKNKDYVAEKRSECEGL